MEPGRLKGRLGVWRVLLVPLVECGKMGVFLSLILTLPSSAEDSKNSYIAETIQPPEGVRLEVGGMDFVPTGELMMCTRRGEIWSYKSDEWKQFAWGLQEPLGLLADGPGTVVVLQRCELTRIKDTDGDGKADLFETICDDWGFTGNYHEYAFGLVRDQEGNYYGNLGLPFMKDPFRGTFLGTRPGIPYRGWVFKVTPKGEFVPLAPGVRAPNGIGMNPAGDIFITDNQGSYVPTGWLMHAKAGDFLGHPSGLIYDKTLQRDPTKFSLDELDKLRKQPAIYAPHGVMGNSTGAPCWDTTGGKFGPFTGHVFVGDVTRNLIFRCSLEKVQGEYQGACYPFYSGKGLKGGNSRLVFAKDGSLYIGQTARGWGSGEGLQRIRYTGKAPFELHTMRLTKNGFEITFTLPIDPQTAKDASAYSLQHWKYKYQPSYRVQKIDRKTAEIKNVSISPDRKRVTLVLSKLAPLKIYELHLKGIKSEAGDDLHHGLAYYTLNRLIEE